MSDKEVKKFKEELKKFCRKQLSSNLVYFDDRIISNISFSENYRSLINYKFSNKPLRDLLISRLEQINKYSPVVVSFIPYFLNLKNIEKLKLPSEESIRELVEEPCLESIEEIINFCFENSSLIKESDFIKIFMENGFISSFGIEKSNSFQNACVFSTGYLIESSVPKIYFEAIKKNQAEVFNSHIILYDGYIEKVSELNSILTNSFENNEKYIIFSRGSHPDVERTCAVNLGLKKASVILAYPNDEFWHDKNLKEISVSHKIDVLGYRTGRLLSSYEKNDSIAIDFSFNFHGVNLKSKGFDINKDAMTKIFLNESNWNKKGLVEDQLNYFRSLVQQISLCGVVSKNSLKSIGIDTESIFLSNQEYFPAFPFFRSIQESKNILNKIDSVGFIINK